MDDRTEQLTIRLPANLVEQIRESAKESRLTVNKLITVLIERGYQAGAIEAITETLRQLTLDILAAAPGQLAAGVSSWQQVERLSEQVEAIDEKLDRIAGN